MKATYKGNLIDYSVNSVTPIRIEVPYVVIELPGYTNLY